MTPDQLQVFATDYTRAWCSQDPERVASCFAPNGTLTINGGAPATGRAAIALSARGFMTAFPDLTVTMDGLEIGDREVEYRWTLTGTNSGPGGTGRPVRISGSERWVFDPTGVVASSIGAFDAASYERQLRGES
jgi:hypothetical protein